MEHMKIVVLCVEKLVWGYFKLKWVVRGLKSWYQEVFW